MAVPAFKDLFLPLLRLAGDGREHTINDALTAIADQMNLSKQDRELTLKSGQKSFYKRLGWAHCCLKQSDLIQKTGRGRFKITQQGLDVLKKNPANIDEEYLKQFPGFVAFISRKKPDPSAVYWFVGASGVDESGEHNDYTQEFVKKGIWRNGFVNKHLDKVKSMKVGDRIAIKAAYIKKKNLPFDNQGKNISVMAIKAVGEITENMNDGRVVKVNWKQNVPLRKWYFYTYQATIWKIKRGEWQNDALIDFAFEGKTQDYERFLGDPRWNNGGGKIVPPKEYMIDHIIDDGCFLNKEKLGEILARLKEKKNLILQGPPGTGKSWLARRLAYALIGKKDVARVRATQFHPNLSYEDFIRGWRPAGDNKLSLVDGPFIEMIQTAKNKPDLDHVFVIEEINRGNPAQIFGEMLTLLEAGKRNSNEAMELSYRRSDQERVYIPENFYVIGTMNIADRSLAMVDLALRRRFAFVELEPSLGEAWNDWMSKKHGIETNIVKDIKTRMHALNETIAADPKLGPQFRIGHSYVTVPDDWENGADAKSWFRRVVTTEIQPLLEEYWFDELDKAHKQSKHLAEGF